MISNHTWQTNIVEPTSIAKVDEAFLKGLVEEIDEPNVTAIVLTGSCARGEETVFSDVDIKRIVKEMPKEASHTRYWREGRLISVATSTIERFRQRLAAPEDAIFVVPGLREACILVDKEGKFLALKEEAQNWRWEPLQPAANEYVTDLLVEYSEWVIKLLRAFLVRDEFALSEMSLGIFSATTLAIIVQRGILAASGNSYFRQAQEAAGFDSTWTHYHRLISQVGTDITLSLEEKGIAALRLFEETVNLLDPFLQSSKREVLLQTITVIHDALPGK